MESSWLNAKSVEEGKQRLNRLGFFETVNAQTVRVPGTEDQVDVLYSVKEASVGSFSGGIGYGTSQGVSFQLGVTQNNFAGTGNQVGIRTMFTDAEKSVNLDYRDPYWTLDGVSLGGNVFYNEFTSKKANIAEYTNTSYGTEVSWGFPFDEINYFDFSLGYQHSTIGNLSKYFQLNEFLKVQDENYTKAKGLDVDDFDWSVSWSRNALNRGFFPTEGSYQRASFRMTVPGSDVQFYKLQYNVRNYLPLSEDHGFTLLTRGRLNYGNGYGEKNGQDYLLPFYENYTAGGFSTLRGFRSNTAGPRAVYQKGSNEVAESIGGNALAAASAELIFPMPFLSDNARRQVRTSVFVDAASVWDTEFDFEAAKKFSGNPNLLDYSDPANYRASYGVSLTWQTFVPLVFSISKPIRKFDEDEEEFFNFTLGRSF